MSKEGLIFRNEEVKRKAALLQNAEKVLKSEFIGIDEVIDGIITNLRPWYLYPELQDKPLVMTLVGLTGTGKTSVVQRLSELIEVKDNLAYFNFAEIGEMKSWEIEDTFEENIDNGVSNKIFVYDEFQYAATVDPDNGGEKDNKTGLKPFWELMDSGILHRRVSIYEIGCVKRLLDYAFRVNNRCRVVLENGQWKNGEECLSFFSPYDRDRLEQVFNVYRIKSVESEDDSNEKRQLPTPQNEPRPVYNEELGVVSYDSGDTDIFIKNAYISKIQGLYERINGPIDIMDFREMLLKMDFYALIDFIQNIVKNSEKGYDMNFSKSVIFVLMNLDEAYEMSFNVNPDMLPDQFHKITKKLTIVDIKGALKKRFRNEQIGRLGNLFMIYPSFSEESFKKIIGLLLSKYAKTVKDKWGIDIEFDESIRDIIYKDSVFPTHGTRPIISSVHEIIKTKLPLVVDNLGENNVENVDKLVYSYVGENVKVVSYSEGKIVGETEIKQNLRIDNHRTIDDKEQQALIAVHESGHFVMYAKLHGKMPEKVCSTTVQKETGGFMLKDDDDFDKIYSREDCLNDIKVSLGGYVAEKLAFGENRRTSGAESDLRKATVAASAMIRNYGLGTRPEVTTYMLSEQSNPGGLLVNDDARNATNQEIRNIISACIEEVERTLNDVDWRKMWKAASQYLSENTTIPKHKMEEFYSLVPDNKKVDSDEFFYRNALNNL